MNRDVIVNWLIGLLTGGGAGTAVWRVWRWATSGTQRKAAVTDTVVGTQAQVVETLSKDYERLWSENEKLRSRVDALEAREDAKDEALHQFVVWAEQARSAAARHVPPLTLPPPPRSPLENR